jgi:hypothetical protein
LTGIPLYAIDGISPIVPAEVQFWIAPGANVICKVRLAAGVSQVFSGRAATATPRSIVGLANEGVALNGYALNPRPAAKAIFPNVLVMTNSSHD